LSVMVSSKFSAVMLIVAIHMLLFGESAASGLVAATESTAQQVRLFHTYVAPRPRYGSSPICPTPI
jgi:hypothetical protein